MVSLNLPLAYEADNCERARQRDWVRGDVRCIMCARLVGRLLGAAEDSAAGRYPSTQSVSFFAYKSADANSRVVTYVPRMRLRCANCGGAGTLDTVEFFSTHDQS